MMDHAPPADACGENLGAQSGSVLNVQIELGPETEIRAQQQFNVFRDRGGTPRGQHTLKTVQARVRLLGEADVEELHV